MSKTTLPFSSDKNLTDFFLPLSTVLCAVLSHSLVSDSLRPHGLSGSSVHVDSPVKNTGVGCHALFQGIFQRQGLKRNLLQCRWILYNLSHQGSLVLSPGPPKESIYFRILIIVNFHSAFSKCKIFKGTSNQGLSFSRRWEPFH